MTLREHIKAGLGEAWTQILEDRLFWELRSFIQKTREAIISEQHKDLISKQKIIEFLNETF